MATITRIQTFFRVLVILAFFCLTGERNFAADYYVAPNGNDWQGDGSAERPWLTVRKAIATVPDDGSRIILKDGLYKETIGGSRAFQQLCTIEAENPYRTRISSPEDSNRVMLLQSLSNVAFRGIDFFGSGSVNNDYLIHITTAQTHDITFENCIIHDSYKNDLIKVNSRAHRIVFRECIFFNQTNRGGDEHFDINTVTDVVVEDSIFFNDYAGSNRPEENAGHPFFVIKNSGSTPNITKDITLRRNIFLNWSGRQDSGFILLGEDGQPFWEAQNILIENNLFLHHSKVPFWGALLFKGGLKDIVVRANTVTGHPTIGGFGTYAVVCINIGANPKMEKISFVNNIFSDPSGKMPRFSATAADRFATDTDLVALNNLYWNAGKPIPSEATDLFIPALDPEAVLDNPMLEEVPQTQILPRLDPKTNRFLSGTTTIREEFERLVALYAVPGQGSAAIGAAKADQMPKENILGKPRGSNPNIGCF